MSRAQNSWSLHLIRSCTHSNLSLFLSLCLSSSGLSDFPVMLSFQQHCPVEYLIIAQPRLSHLVDGPGSNRGLFGLKPTPCHCHPGTSVSGSIQGQDGKPDGYENRDPLSLSVYVSVFGLRLNTYVFNNGITFLSTSPSPTFTALLLLKGDFTYVIPGLN